MFLFLLFIEMLDTTIARIGEKHYWLMQLKTVSLVGYYF